jgi:hypothetical protein
MTFPVVKFENPNGEASMGGAAVRARRAGRIATDVRLGEIHTGILMSAAGLESHAAAELFAALSFQPTLTWERPIRHAAAPEVLTGVDCLLPSTSGSRSRAVGTVATQVSVTAGRVLQAATHAWVIPADQPRRLSWSHYLASPATVESLGTVPADLEDGFLAQDTRQGVLDLAGVCVAVMNRVQHAPGAERRAPFRARRTRLRWAATVRDGDAADLAYTLEDEDTRTVRIKAPAGLVERVPALCQDLALHDWLLSCVVALVDLAGIGHREHADVVDRLRPAVDHLLHAWMPGARLDEDLAAFWSEVERRTGFSRQWEVTVQRIRDQMTLAAVELMGAAANGTVTLPDAGRSVAAR